MTLFFVITSALVYCFVVALGDQSTAVQSYVSAGDTVGGNFLLQSRIDYLGAVDEVDKSSSGNDIDNFLRGKKPYSFAGRAVEGVRYISRNKSIGNHSFLLNEHIFRGGHGEIWKAQRVINGSMIDHNASYILKRMNTKDNPHIYFCALREIYFGKLTRGMPRVARFLKHFVIGDDYWLVFRDEGISLQGLLYTMKSYLQPSPLWRKIRTTAPGAQTLKGIIYEVFASVADLHDAGVLHRDLKPSNLLVAADSSVGAARIVAADFSSAVDDASLMFGLYGDAQMDQSLTGRPGLAEETLQYAPPEVLLFLSTFQGTNAAAAYDAQHPFSYDSWSLGVLFLEMVLGTPDVFSVDQRTFALIQHRLRGQNESEISNALLLAALSEYCIYVPSESGGAHQQSSSSSRAVAETVSGLGGESIENSEGGGLTSSLSVPAYETSLLDLQKEGESALQLLGSSSGSDHADTVTPVVQISEITAPPTSSGRRSRASGKTGGQCREDPLKRLSLAISRRDTQLGIGFSDRWGLDLIRRLLAFDPGGRISAIDALSHAYFVGPYISTVDGSEHATPDDLSQYEDLRSPRGQHSSQSVTSPVASSSGVVAVVAVTGVNADLETSDLQATLRSSPESGSGLDGVNLKNSDQASSRSHRGASKAAAFLIHLGSKGVIPPVVPAADPTDRVTEEHGVMVPVSLSVVSEVIAASVAEWESMDGAVSALVPVPAAGSLGDEVLCYSTEVGPSRTSTSEAIASTSQSFAVALFSSLSPDIVRLASDASNKTSLLGADGKTNSTSARPASASADQDSSPQLMLSASSVGADTSPVIRADLELADASWTFRCPHCGREVFSSYDSCLQHALKRRHGTYCRYEPVDRSQSVRASTSTDTSEKPVKHQHGHGLTALPECLSEYTMMPMDEHSGWCDVRGRRKYMEDSTATDHSARFNYTYYGVFDGHYGTHAASFAAQHLRRFIDDEISSVLAISEREFSGVDAPKLSVDLASRALLSAFAFLDAAYIRTEMQEEELELLYGASARGSGTTATVALFFPQSTLTLESPAPVDIPVPTRSIVAEAPPPHASLSSTSGYVLVANIGDSHAALCCASDGLPLLVTAEHTPYNPKERERVSQAGGFVVAGGDEGASSVGSDGTLRVNGTLAVTRSFGDRSFKCAGGDGIVSPVPDVAVINLFTESLQRGSTASSADFDIMRKVEGVGANDASVQSELAMQKESCIKKCSKYKQLRNQLLNLSTSHNFNFLIIASDGLWDVVPLHTATEMVCESLMGSVLRTVQELEWYARTPFTASAGAGSALSVSSAIMEWAYHDAAKMLAHEAYIRGSSDNIGVCIVDIV